EHLAVAPRLHDRLRLIEDRDERHAAETLEVLDERPHDRFRLLVVNERDLDVTRILQTTSEEVHTLLRVVHEANVDVPEVVLREFAGQTLEAHDRPRRRRT